MPKVQVVRISADVICAVVALIAAIFAASSGNLLAVAVTSAFFGSSVALILADWRYMREMEDLTRRIDRLETLHRNRKANDV
jgi:hypothetical protein